MRPVNAYLNGVSLRDLDGRILVRTIREQPPQSSLLYGDNPGRDGQRLLGRSRITRCVTVVFALRELRDLSARAALVDRVNAWAQDGILAVSFRPEQQLCVLVSQRAAMYDPRDYTEDYQIELEAAASPYWEARAPQTVTLTGTGGSGELLNPGTAPAEAEATVTPTDGALDTLTLDVGAARFAFSGLGVAAGTPLRVYHDARGFLRIEAGGGSCLHCRRPESDDELIAAPGVNAVRFAANTACRVAMEVRGRWL